MNGPPPPPSNEPEPRPLEPAPPVSAGLNFDGVKDWFLKFDTIRELADDHHQERVRGLRIALALSLMSKVILGWYHSSTVGGSVTHVHKQDLKLGAGFYLGFITANKTEIVKGNKDEKILGWKWSKVSKTKNRMGAGNEQRAAIQRAKFKNRCADYWTLQKEVSTQLKETIKQFMRENATVQEDYKKCKDEFDKATFEVGTEQTRADSMTSTIDNLLCEATSVKTHATAELKIIADSAADFLASASWEGDFGSELKLHCSFQEFAASISKLG